MSQTDFWYIRFPDGRILRADSTSVVRQGLHAGHIPLASTVRRSPHDEWVALAWTREFSDLVDEVAAREPPSPPEPRRRRSAEPRPASGAAHDRAAAAGAPLDRSRLPVVGVRGYLDELWAALDSTLVFRKLLVAALAGLLLGALFALERAAWFEEDSRSRTMVLSLPAVGLVVFAGLTGLLTRLTYVELARLRPARWREGLAGLGGLTVWIVFAQLIVGGAAWGSIALLRWLPLWLGGNSEGPGAASQQILSGSALALGMILEVLLWPVLFFWWLMPPLLAVEACTVWRGLLLWLRLLRRHLGQVFLYQTMAAGLGVLLTAPFLLLIAPLFLPNFYLPEPLQEVAGGTRALLLGAACSPLLAYWITSNVFIYLNLRYGAGSRR